MIQASAWRFYCTAFVVAAVTSAMPRCHRIPDESVPARAGASVRVASSARPAPAISSAPSETLTPLAAEWLERLDLPNGRFAFVAPPVGSTEPRPVVVAIHGGGDRPEWACGGWRLACHAYAFVLCPGGTSLGNGNYAWASSRGIAEAIEASLARLHERYGVRISAAPAIYAGFSQGATLARPVVLASRERYQAAIFAEGGYDVVDRSEFAASFNAAGGRSVMLVCGGAPCFARMKRGVTALKDAGLSVLTVGDPLAGHNLNQRMQVALQGSWAEFVSGLDGWSGYR